MHVCFPWKLVEGNFQFRQIFVVNFKADNNKTGKGSSMSHIPFQINGVRRNFVHVTNIKYKKKWRERESEQKKRNETIENSYTAAIIEQLEPQQQQQQQKQQPQKRP